MCAEISSSAIKRILAETSCPFTWGIAESAALYRSLHWAKKKCEDEDESANEDLPLERFMRLLILCYENVMSAQTECAEEKLNDCETMVTDIYSRKEFTGIKRAIEHVFNATKSYFLYETQRIEELEEFIKNVIDKKDLNGVENGALLGLESIAWSMFHDFGTEKAIDRASKAANLDGSNGLWHFVLAKNLRRKRRISSVHSSPCLLEQKHFKLAYDMSKNSTFGVYYAQMRREMTYTVPRKSRDESYWERTEADLVEIYKDILNSNPTSVKVLLKLALGFIRTNYKDCSELAETCLDKVEKISKDNPTYYHYKGLLYEHTGNFQEAVKYFKKAAEFNNFVAEMNYVNYAHEVGELEKPTPYLLRMLTKYENCVKEREQQLYLNIATSYYMIDKDNKKAAEYYQKAISSDPNSKKLKSFYTYLGFNTKSFFGSVYNFLNRKFIPELRSQYANDFTVGNLCRQLQSSCNEFNERKMNNFTRNFQNMKF